MIQNTMQKVFCYGTLKSGYGNHDRYLKNSRKLGNGQIYGVLIHLGGIPGLVRDTDCRVVGEVYEVDWKTMADLDRLEGAPTLYNRQQVLMGQTFGRVWTYYYSNPPVLKDTTQVVSHGIWRGGRADVASYAATREFFRRSHKSELVVPETLISLPPAKPGFDEIIKGETPPDILAGAAAAAASIRRIAEPVVGPGLEEM